MLSIALICAALLAAGFVLQLRSGADERLGEAKPYTGISPAGAVAPSVMATGVGGGDIVALALRVPNIDCACENARKFADKTFLVAEAPKLPFRDCGRVDCRCRYERISNRRKGERRVHNDRRDAIRFELKDDRRTGKDRRKSNNAWKRPL